jgi:hypothetical protein
MRRFSLSFTLLISCGLSFGFPAGHPLSGPSQIAGPIAPNGSISPKDLAPGRPAPGNSIAPNDPDLPFRQAISTQYPLPEELKKASLLKVITDYNDNAYVLTDKGLYYISQGRLVRDLRFRAQSRKVPLDVVAQEGSGHLFYLYDDKYLTNGYAGIPYSLLPKGKYRTMAVAADGSIMLAGPKEWGFLRQGKVTPIPAISEPLLSLQVQGGAYYALTTKAVYRFSGQQFIPLHTGKDLKAMSFRGKDIILGTAQGYYGINASTADTSFTLQSRLPVPDVGHLLVVFDRIWAGTAIGAFMREDTGHFRYYASRRWLLNDNVKDMAADTEGNVYFLTDNGLSKLSFPYETLAAKAAGFQRSIRERKIRYGLISEVRLTQPGDLSTSELVDTDNDGLWSSFYLGSQAFRFAVTREDNARRYAWETFEAFERLLSIHSIKGFPARTFERKGYAVHDPKAWRNSPDPEWEWKGTTSSDEYVGWIFAAAVMDEAVARTEDEHQRIANFIDKILTHIIDHDYNLIDADGQHTLWGRWNPDYINWYPESVFDRRLGSTTIIAGLQLAYRLTGRQRYKDEAFRLMNEHGYLKNILIGCNKIHKTPGYIYDGHDMSDGVWNHSDDEMAFLTYWVLYKYAFTDSLRDQFAGAIRDHWQFEKPERNALWNLISYGTIGEYDKESTFWHLREYPLDLVEWDIKNSHRKDINLLPENIRRQWTAELLPPGEQPMHRHNSNFFRLDGGSGGREELAGDEYLLPYWMGRYLKVIE